MADRRQVILVDVSGAALSVSDKLAAHEPPGALHLAFSVFLVRSDGTVLVQQRATSKYHFPGVWANACCSHPEPGEELVSSARRRVREELGIEVGELVEAGSFVYRAADPQSGLVEHEYDHVLVGTIADGVEAVPDPSEVAAVTYLPRSALEGAGPAEGFAPWFAEALGIASRALEAVTRGR